jgi:hypothetical protein
LWRQNGNADDEIATGVCEPRRAAGGMPIADLEYTMTTNDDPFEPIEDLAAVRGGPCAGVWWLYDILCRSADGAARPGSPPQALRRPLPAGLEADLAAVADIRRSLSSERIAAPDRADDSYPDLARAFGGKHHTTVSSAVQKIIERIKDDASLRSEVHAGIQSASDGSDGSPRVGIP